MKSTMRELAFEVQRRQILFATREIFDNSDRMPLMMPFASQIAWQFRQNLCFRPQKNFPALHAASIQHASHVQYTRIHR